MSVEVVTGVSATAFAALAAGASWASVVQTQRLERERQQPTLHGQVLRVGRLGDSPGAIAFTVLNAGGGLAKGPAVVLASEREFCLATIGTGFLHPGEQAHIGTELSPSAQTVRGIMMCRDLEERVWGWTLDGRCEGLGRPEPGDGFGVSDIWLRLYGDELKADRTQVPCRTSVGSFFNQ